MYRLLLVDDEKIERNWNPFFGAAAAFQWTGNRSCKWIRKHSEYLSKNPVDNFCLRM